MTKDEFCDFISDGYANLQREIGEAVMSDALNDSETSALSALMDRYAEERAAADDDPMLQHLGEPSGNPNQAQWLNRDEIEFRLERHGGTTYLRFFRLEDSALYRLRWGDPS